MSRRLRSAWLLAIGCALASPHARAADLHPRLLPGASAPSSDDSRATAGALDDLWQQVAPQPSATPEPRLIPRPKTEAQSTARQSVEKTHAESGWGRSALSLAIVMALIGLLAWGYRAVAGDGAFLLRARSRRAGLIELVSRTSLSPRQSLCLIRVGPRLVLVGVCRDSIHPLHTIDDPDLTARLAGQAAARDGRSHVVEFQHCLAGESQSYAADPAEVQASSDEPPAAAPLRLHERLNDTLRRLRRAVG